MRQLKITNRITNRESIALDKYLNDISKIPLIGPEDEARLARKIKKGDEEALDSLVKANLRFVVSVAKQYQNQGLSLSDLINEGNVGLMKAAKRFDETRGFKFISYAVWWIRQSILQAIVEYSRMVRLPLNKVNAFNTVNQALLRFVQDHEREPSISELSDLVEMPIKDIEKIMSGIKRHISFDAPLSREEESGNSMLDLLADTNSGAPDLSLMQDSLKNEVKIGLSMLSPREADVIIAYYGLKDNQPRTLEEVGDLYGLTRERVRQIKERGLRRMRKSVKKDNLKQFLG
ncbi:UNVERIFIED_CONTAM: hypothetical protein GTU68_040766 [Idotea baltica]|nr:hypothetical protein [Idotea baltica]